MHHTELIDKLLRELSYKVGVPNIYDKEHQYIMSEILSDWGEYDAKEKIFEFLTEKDEKTPEDEKYFNTGGKGYIRMADKAKYDAQGKDFDGDTFSKDGPGSYTKIEKDASTNPDDAKSNDAVNKTMGKQSQYGKDQQAMVTRVKARKDKEKSKVDSEDAPLSVEERKEIKRKKNIKNADREREIE